MDLRTKSVAAMLVYGSLEHTNILFIVSKSLQVFVLLARKIYAKVKCNIKIHLYQVYSGIFSFQ